MPYFEERTTNTLSLRLTESAVFLRTRPGRRSNESSPPSILRGLLVLDLAKPTSISSIELELVATTSTAWPEGFGARRIEVTEEHTVFHVSVIYFRAGQAPARRPTSVGPGISLHDGYEDWDESPPTPSSPDVSQLLTQSPSWQPRRVSFDAYFRRPHMEHYDIYHRVPPYSPITATPPMTSRATSPASSTVHSPSPGPEIPTTSSSEGRHRGRSTLSSVPDLNTRLLHERLRSQQNGVHDEGADLIGQSSRSITPNHRCDNSHERKGRSRSRFSLAYMSNALLDVMRPKQSHYDADENLARGRPLEKNNPVVRDDMSPSRGRPLGKGWMTVGNQMSNERPTQSKERTTLGMLGDILKLDYHDDCKGDGVTWKEFKKGTYTYPVSISIPGHSPPTLHCEFGNVTWRLKAVVHRPGAFRSKLTATREVIVVACPIEDAAEETGNIIVERHWEQQLQYLIVISGRSFYIGGTMPVSFTLMPFAKVKIYKIHVSIEERIDYYTQMNRIARTDPVTRIDLLNVKGGDDPILPLDSDDVDAFRNSPLYNLATQDDDLSEMASSLMGPGPWTFHQDLQLPHSCSYMRFTNKNKNSNIAVTHTLKWIMRVARGDDLYINPKTGRRKLYDIVVQTPVQILSCRCNPEWTSLPGYSERFSDAYATVSSCPCNVDCGVERPTFGSQFMSRRPGALERIASMQSSSSASSVEASPVNITTMRSLRQTVPTLLQVSSQYERLVSGQETETGETPPAYEA